MVQQKEQELTISQFCLRSLGKFKRTVYDYEIGTFVGPWVVLWSLLSRLIPIDSIKDHEFNMHAYQD